MKSYDDLRDLIGDDFRDAMTEGVIRTSAIALSGSKSRQAGIRAERAYSQARSKLKRGDKNETLEDKLEHIEGAIQDILVGLIAARYQLGHATALNVAGHLMTARNKKR